MESSSINIAAVICAAGSSSRMGAGGKKEFQELSPGVTVLGAAVSAFLKTQLVEIIIIVITEGTEAQTRAALPLEFLELLNSKIFLVNGGKTRRASVFNALSFLEKFNPCYVLIHDGARPRVNPSLIADVIKAVQKYNAVIPVLPFLDTPKEYNVPLNEKEDVFITRHLKRVNTGAAQAPQGFKFCDIFSAHKKAAETDEEFTDDAEIYGRFCGKVAVIPGLPENKKITFPEDLGKNFFL